MASLKTTRLAHGPQATNQNQEFLFVTAHFCYAPWDLVFPKDVLKSFENVHYHAVAVMHPSERKQEFRDLVC